MFKTVVLTIVFCQRARITLGRREMGPQSREKSQVESNTANYIITRIPSSLSARAEKGRRRESVAIRRYKRRKGSESRVSILLGQCGNQPASRSAALRTLTTSRWCSKLCSSRIMQYQVFCRGLARSDIGVGRQASSRLRTRHWREQK